MIDVKAGDKACKRFVLFSILYLIITAFVLDTPAEIFAGMKRIVISRDALITDYSSIYYDFLLCDKPVAAIWEDIEEYRINPGFAVDVDYYMKGAEKIYNLDDFETFVTHVAEDLDVLRSERAEINTLVNHSTDGKNAQRVVDFIVEKAGL